MKRKLGESKEHFAHRVLWTRSATIWRHQRDRAKALSLPLGFTVNYLRIRIVEAVGKPCPYCGIELTPKTFSIDHEISLSRGGTVDPDNCTVCCQICNERKGILSGQEFSSLLALLNAWEPPGRTDVLRRLRAGSKALRRMFAKK